jgi:hypothetical protein
MADTLLGRSVRCIGCDHRFVASLDNALPSVPGRSREPPRPARGPRRHDEVGPREGEYGPFCPGCGKRIGWDAPACPFCGEELEPEDGLRRWRHQERLRRDCEPHRGALIANLGNASMFIGGLSLCLCGLGAAVSIPLGVAAWVMANRDLALMRSGAVDPAGRAQTEAGRTGAVVGIVLSLIFATFFAVVYWNPF